MLAVQKSFALALDDQMASWALEVLEELKFHHCLGQNTELGEVEHGEGSKLDRVAVEEDEPKACRV